MKLNMLDRLNTAVYNLILCFNHFLFTLLSLIIDFKLLLSFQLLTLILRLLNHSRVNRRRKRRIVVKWMNSFLYLFYLKRWSLLNLMMKSLDLILEPLNASNKLSNHLVFLWCWSLIWWCH